jgi:hypothetical protein
VTRQQTPLIDRREARQIMDVLSKRGPAYLPDWIVQDKSPIQALSQIFSRYMEVLIERLNQAPDKNLLAFLDMLGIGLIPARSARAPVVFQTSSKDLDGRVEPATRLGAQVAGKSDSILFETERAVAVAAARLVEVRTVIPAQDVCADHSTACTGKRAFRLFSSAKPVPHELYIAHDTLFAFTGKPTLQLEIELASAGSSSIAIAWEYWDGQVWRPLALREDGTCGLTRSGTLTLSAQCGRSAKTKVYGIDAYWVRGRAAQSLPPDPTRQFPTIDRIGLKAFLESGSEATANPGPADTVLLPDYAFAEGLELDTTKEFYPFGRAPDRDSAFYFSSQEIFGKPGAKVTVRLRRAITPEDEADKEGQRVDCDVNHAYEVLFGTETEAGAFKEAAQGVYDAAEKVNACLETADKIKTSDLKAAIDKFPKQGAYKNIPFGRDKAQYLYDKVKTVVMAFEAATKKLPTVTDPPSQAAQDCYNNKYRDAAKQAAEHMREILSADSGALGLVTLGPYPAAKLFGTQDAKLEAPKLVWEYWDGRRWKTLVPARAGLIDNLGIEDLKKAPPEIQVRFTVPKDMTPTRVSGIKARWVRVRIATGSYNRLRLVSWYDVESAKINFYTLIEPRPPALDLFALSYVYRSSDSADQSGGSGGASSLPPEHCLTYNDFQYGIQSQTAKWPGRFFTPFRPMADRTPALYFGLDRSLPQDLIGLYLDIEEGKARTPELVWEAWDGRAWRQVTVKDETAALRRSGIVSFLAPKPAQRQPLSILQATDSRITLDDPVSSALFEAGDQVVVREGRNQEMATVRARKSGDLLLQIPLSQTYNGGTLAKAGLPRFGTPRDWLRARLRTDGKPSKSRVRGVHLNAAWAVQRQTVENESLGSGTGQPGQTVFFSQSPILPGERIEVRELSGARAAVEWPMLREELLAQGCDEEDFRTVADRQSGRAKEVWVRWQARPHLFFSGPDDRHYMLERARGRVIFGDGLQGRMPPVGANNMVARRYRTGGGLAGNVAAGSITQLLGVATGIRSVTNPRAADGGADGEPMAQVRWRGPRTLRHRGRSVSASDYETLAREASPGVAAVRVLPATAPNGRPAPGWLTLIIVPQSQDARPQPSYELRRQVHAHLADRAPATVASSRIGVIGPTYLPVGVAATIAVRDPSEAAVVLRRVKQALERFLHPLTGGPDQCGWSFGRDVYLSDVAAVVEPLSGVDYASRLELLSDDIPQGDRLEVPPDRMVVAGTLEIRAVTSEPAFME